MPWRHLGLTLLLVGLTGMTSGCTSCVTDDGTYYIAATPTRDPGDAPVDITNTTHTALVTMRDAIRNAEPGDQELFLYEGDAAGDKERKDALAALSRELHGTEEWSTIIVDETPYALSYLHAGEEC